MSGRRSLAALLLACSLARYGMAMCYYPNGEENVAGTPCNASAANSACCGPGDICLSNSYCYQQSGRWSNRLARGTCTDPTWKDPSCPYYCADVNTDNSVSLYLAKDLPTGYFCCSYGEAAYDPSTGRCLQVTQNSTQPFNISRGAVIYDRMTGATLYTTLDLSNLTSNGTTSSNSTSQTGAATVQKNSNIAPVAAGIAAPLGVLLLAAIATIAVLWRKLKKAQRQLHNIKPDYASSGSDATAAVKQPMLASPASPMHQHYPQPAYDRRGYDPQPVYDQRGYDQPVYEVSGVQQNKIELPAKAEAKEVPGS